MNPIKIPVNYVNSGIDRTNELVVVFEKGYLVIEKDTENE